MTSHSQPQGLVMRKAHGWRLKRTAQCRKCPWLVGTNPHEIPNGYSEERHRALEQTIAHPSDGIFGALKTMACHEGNDAHCVGWLVNQVGPGNNIGLRIRMMTCDNASKIRLRGDQHQRFEDTLP